MSAPVTLGGCTLHLGDCRTVLPTLTFDAIVSDPPYGIGFQRGPGGHGRHHRRTDLPITGDLAPFDPSHLLKWPCVLFGANHYFRLLPEGGTFHSWDKHCGAGPDDDFSDVEFIWSSSRCKSRAIRHRWKGVIRDSENGEPRYHVSQKPVAVMAELVRMAHGRVVCDPYMGSGSTGVACARLGRPFIGIEIDPAHFATALRRIEAAHRQADLFVERPAPRPEQATLALGDAA